MSLEDFEIDEIDVTEVKGLEDDDIYLQAEATLTDVKQTHLGSLASIRMRVEIEGQEKAACVADTLSLFVG